MYNAVLIGSVQPSESVINIHIPTLFQILFTSWEFHIVFCMERMKECTCIFF